MQEKRTRLSRVGPGRQSFKQWKTTSSVRRCRNSWTSPCGGFHSKVRAPQCSIYGLFLAVNASCASWWDLSWEHRDFMYELEVPRRSVTSAGHTDNDTSLCTLWMFQDRKTTPANFDIWRLTSAPDQIPLTALIERSEELPSGAPLEAPPEAKQAKQTNL